MTFNGFTIKELVKENRVTFSFYRQQNFYYILWQEYSDHEKKEYVINKYQFPVPLDDIGDATLSDTDKAIFFMRYIRKAIKDGTIVRIN